MINPKNLDELSQQLGKLLPAGLQEMKADFEQNAKSTMQGAFSNMDLVTREDFDIQVALVQRLNQRVEQLEARVEALESELKK